MAFGDAIRLAKKEGIISVKDGKIAPGEKMLAGLENAKSMGFTHTNPAKTYFDDDNQMISRKPKSAIKETK